MSSATTKYQVLQQRFMYINRILTDMSWFARHFLSDEETKLRQRIMSAEGVERTLLLVQEGEKLIERMGYEKHPNRDLVFFVGE